MQETLPESTLDGGIRSRILTVRGVQVMLDRDLAELYGVETKRLNEQVRRNAERFPEGFMFQLSETEFAEWRSQIAASNWKSQFATSNSFKMGLRHRPYAFTEHGITMLASVLKSQTAVQVSIRVVTAFIAMRRFVTSNAEVFRRMDAVEKRQILTDARVDAILERLDAAEPPAQGVFYDGQLWDACSLVEKLLARAKKSILLIDGWLGPGTLDMLAKKREAVAVEIVTSPHGNRLAASDVAKFNAQYGGLTVRTSAAFHDRFLVLDDQELYLIGASLKDLGKKCFAFTRLDAAEIAGLKKRLKGEPEI